MKRLVVVHLIILLLQRDNLFQLIDAQPENTTHAQQCRFQTEMLGVVMDHLLAADILIGDQVPHI